LGFAYHLLSEENTKQLLKLAESVCVHPNLSSVRDVIENAVFSLENAFRNSNFDDFNAAFQKAFYDSTTDNKINKNRTKISPYLDL
jgi:hypothetical protein